MSKRKCFAPKTMPKRFKMAEFTVEARRYLEEHGFDYGGLVPEKLSQRVKVTTTSKEFFRISIRNCEYKTTMKFPKVCKA